MVKLGVNIDHVATVRQARGGVEPSPLEAAFICEKAGADGITAHLREDRRHIQDADIEALLKNVNLPLNLEMALSNDIVEKALAWSPSSVCIVPEKREELTTEGGLNVAGQKVKLKSAIDRFKEKSIGVSLFIDPVEEQIAASAEVGADYIELHTGDYANSFSAKLKSNELKRLRKAAEIAIASGLVVNAGHGLNYNNVQEVSSISGMNELNIGHSIIARAIFSGLFEAVVEMKSLMNN